MYRLGLLLCLLTPLFAQRTPGAFLPSGPRCMETPDWQVQEYTPDTLILRESGCTNYEKPFLYLLFGEKRAMLLDSGAGDTDVARFVSGLLKKYSERTKQPLLPLLVVHSHSHGDHISGDKQLAALPQTEVVSTTLEGMLQFYGFRRWPEFPTLLDLGGREIEAIPIPGHHETSVAFYDRRTHILLTGDSLYPGRLYVSDLPAFKASMHRLVLWTQTKPIAHVFGTHIEQTDTPFKDYPTGTIYQPHEHELALSRGHLLELDEALQGMTDPLAPVARRDFTIVPRNPVLRAQQSDDFKRIHTQQLENKWQQPE